MARATSGKPKVNDPTVPGWLVVTNVALALFLVLILVFMLFFLSSPTPDQRDIERVLIAVLFGALGATLTGTATLKAGFELGGGKKIAITATAGLALLLIAYFVPPYWNPPAPSKGDCVNNPMQRGC